MNHSSHAAALENALAPIFAKTPHLPHGVRQTLVTIAPWLALIFGVIGLFGVFSIFSMLPYLMSMPFAAGMMGTSYMPMMVSLIVAAISGVLDVLAFKPLMAHKKRGWNLLFYGSLLSLVSTLVTVIFGYGSGLMSIIGTIIGFWLLFEIRESYHA